MKPIYLFCCALLVAALMGSCSDDTTTGTDTQTAPAGTMTAQLNGTAFASDNGAISSSAEFVRSSRLLSIFGRKGANDELGISIYTLNGTGTYTLGGAQGEGLGSYAHFDHADSTQTRSYSTSTATSGSVTISKFDTVGGKVSGSFTFDAIQVHPAGTTNTMAVRSGSFTDLPMTIR